MDSNEMISLLSQILDEKIGMVTAYAYAKSKGYSGSADDFANDMANIGVNISAIETAINTFNNQTVPNAETAITTAGSNQVTAVNTAGQEQLQNVTAEGGRQVGLVTAAGTAQTEAVNTAGTTQTAAVNNAGSTQVSNVNSAGSQQITAIQQKGEETRQSIPADYTALSDSVEGLQSAIGTGILLEYGNGYIEADGTIAAQGAGVLEVYTNTYIPVSEGQVITATLTHSTSRAMWFVYAEYDEAKTFKRRVDLFNSTGSTYTATITIPADVAFIRFSFRTFDDFEFSFSYGESVLERLMVNESNIEDLQTENSHLIGAKSKQFVCTDGNGHSATADQITGLNFSAGDTFFLQFSRALTNWTYFFGYDDNGNSQQLLSTNETDGVYKVEATQTITKVGWSDSSTSGVRTFFFAVWGEDSLRAAIDDAETKATMAVGDVDLTQFFELGAVNIGSSGWTYSQNFKRVRTKKDITLHIPAGVKIGLKDYTNARLYIGWVTSEGTHGSNGWRTSDYSTTVEGDYVFQIAERSDEQYQTDLSLASLFFGYKPQALPYSETNKTTLDNFKQLPINMQSGYLGADGKIGGAGEPQEVTSEFVPVESDSEIYCVIKHSAVHGCWAAVCQYDSEKKMVGSRYLPLGAGSTIDFYNFYINPSSDAVRYVRFSYRTYGDATANVYISNPVAVNKLLIDDSFTAVGMFNMLLNTNVKGINHRGYSDIAPENTLSAFKLSKKKGFNYVETDVRFTSDGVAVLLHDDSINRTARNTDGTELSSTVNIADITYEQALTYDFGIYKGSDYAGIQIPTFKEFMTLCRNIGLHPYIELKAGDQAQISELVEIVKDCGMLNNSTWIAFNSQHLEYVQASDTDARLGLLTGTITETEISTASALKNNVNEVFIDSSDTSTTAINLCKTADIPVEAWTVNNRTTLLNLDPYFTGVTSDRLNAGYELYLANK